jgi:hypothetical protein
MSDWGDRLESAAKIGFREQRFADRMECEIERERARRATHWPWIGDGAFNVSGPITN